MDPLETEPVQELSPLGLWGEWSSEKTSLRGSEGVWKEKEASEDMVAGQVQPWSEAWGGGAILDCLDS